MTVSNCSRSPQRLRADLHLHTMHSDGALTPSALLRIAAGNGLKLLSITDHDSVAGIPEAERAAHKYKLLFIPGVELEAFIETEPGHYHSVHLLGYGLNYRETALVEYLAEIREARLERLQGMLGKLRNLGIKVDFSAVQKNATGESVGRVHLARTLKQNNHVQSFDQAFERYIGNDRPAYVAKPRHSPRKIIRLIHDCGGIAVWAHPYFTGNDDLLPELIKQGVDGLEAYHHEFNQQTTEHYLQLAEQNNLLITGGSDFHGTMEEQFEPGDWWYEANSLEQWHRLSSVSLV